MIQNVDQESSKSINKATVYYQNAPRWASPLYFPPPPAPARMHRRLRLRILCKSKTRQDHQRRWRSPISHMRAKASNVTAKIKPSRRQASRRTSRPKMERVPLSERKATAKQGTDPTLTASQSAWAKKTTLTAPSGLGL